MRKSIFFLISILSIVFSCTKEKTDYKAEIDTLVPEYSEFKEVAQLHTQGYRIILEALNGELYTGYNEIRIRVLDTQTNQLKPINGLQFLPIRWSEQAAADSAPHQYEFDYHPENGYYQGYVVFTDESDGQTQWELYLRLCLNGRELTISDEVTVKAQPNKNLHMTEFTGNDGERYYIALIAPQVPRVADNPLIAGLYRHNVSKETSTGEFPDPREFSFSPVEGYTLQLDPRMPEPSMGNHSSPGNQDLSQGSDGLYYGIVNYTMTGNWTLNFIMRDQSHRVIKGTKVPDDFTPGVEGTKSELYIDILF